MGFGREKEKVEPKTTNSGGNSDQKGKALDLAVRKIFPHNQTWSQNQLAQVGAQELGILALVKDDGAVEIRILEDLCKILNALADGFETIIPKKLHL